MASGFTDRESLVAVDKALVSYQENLVENVTKIRESFEAYASFSGNDEISQKKIEELMETMSKFEKAYKTIENVRNFVYKLILKYDQEHKV